MGEINMKMELSPQGRLQFNIEGKEDMAMETEIMIVQGMTCQETRCNKEICHKMEEVMHRKVEKTLALEEEMVTREIICSWKLSPQERRNFPQGQGGNFPQEQQGQGENFPLKNIGIFHSDTEITSPLKIKGASHKDIDVTSLKNNKDREETPLLKNIGIFYSDREITSPLKIKGTSHKDR
ncbi:multiple organellar RNA editing factor 1, mitochondrial-like [Iris pallida]|uniref:Multiple organellar RNA editing factor 1, mitochondrial-like n=1 Tax=Iris pallida TaxID=29817 RepID=A0AAX6IJ07_IRIPA|nr:multiple organellar RNA editing factor 1, mitochondrial-like [Iris pallida]